MKKTPKAMYCPHCAAKGVAIPKDCQHIRAMKKTPKAIRGIKPYGTRDCEKHLSWFDPKKPVRMCYYSVNKFGMALGFKQARRVNKMGWQFFSAIFMPKIDVIEYDHGGCGFGAKTIEKFQALWDRIYGIPANIEMTKITGATLHYTNG